MFETSGPWPSQQHSSLEMIAPANIRQHEVILPTSVNPNPNPFRVYQNPGFNEFGTSVDPCIGSMGNSMLYSPPELCTQNRFPLEQISKVPQVGEKRWTYNPPCPEERKFLIFDQSGNETRMMFSSLCPGVLRMPTKQTICPFFTPEAAFSKQFDADKFLPGQLCMKTSVVDEESGENEILDEECREDTEEINALLYSEGDDDYDDDGDSQDDGYEDEDDEEVSSGHSPLLVKDEEGEKLRELDSEDDVAISSISSKRRKTLDGEREKENIVASEKVYSGDFISDVDEGTSMSPVVGSKRPRKNKIHDTLKALKTILPGLKNNKDPVSILDEAISYLKCLKYNAESMSMEDSDNSNSNSGCYEPLN